ncbi:MAG: hypothetical protein DSZ12_04725 [Sulfurovum sp.]|nr:MAG: hypothetical protein DSZ12_04725 [Sulfurovum sp.]
MKEKEKLQKAFNNKRIGLSLSGGGYRAALFHLGVLSYMAKHELLEHISHISTVSGGSIVMGLIYRLNAFKFPTSKAYLENVHTQAIEFLKETTLLEDNMKISAAKASATNGQFALNKKMLRRLKGKVWGLDKDIQTLEDTPIWTINATTGETGKSWRFSKKRMGDYLIGYMKNPHISLAEAIAASAGFPIAIGPLPLYLNKYGYKTKDHYTPGSGDFPREKVTLYDGGLYDNLGTEVFFGANATRFPKSIDFLIVSDASAPFNIKKDMASLWWFGKLNQISDIATEQIRSLRIRMFHNLVDKQNEPDLGMLIRIGSGELGMEEEAKCAKNIETDLKSFSTRKTNCLINNGHDAASKNFSNYLTKLQELKELEMTDTSL